MDKNLNISLLLDFYGEVLTEKQRETVDMYYNEDLSLSEIADITGLSRPGVRDRLVKSETILRELEEKLGLLARFEDMKKQVDEITCDLVKLKENGKIEGLDNIIDRLSTLSL